MSLPDVIESFETRDGGGVSSRGPLRGFVGAPGYWIRSGPHVNQLDRDAIEDRGLSYFGVEHGHQMGAREAVMPS